MKSENSTLYPSSVGSVGEGAATHENSGASAHTYVRTCGDQLEYVDNGCLGHCDVRVFEGGKLQQRDTQRPHVAANVVRSTAESLRLQPLLR